MTQRRLRGRSGWLTRRRTIEEFTSVDTPFGTFEMMAGSTVDLLAVPSGAVVATRSVAYEPTDTRWTTLDRTLISEDGTRLWVNENTAVMDVDTCGSATPTIPETCTIDNQCTIAGGRTRTFPLDGGDLTGFDITPDGLLRGDRPASPDPGGRGRVRTGDHPCPAWRLGDPDRGTDHDIESSRRDLLLPLGRGAPCHRPGRRGGDTDLR